MKNDKLIPGLILVIIGATILLANYGYLHFHWYNIFRLWPIFLVIGGVNLVFANNKSPWATILKIAVVILGFGLVLFGNFGNRYDFWPSHAFYYHNDDNNDNNNSDDDDDNDDNNNTKGAVSAAVGGVFNEPYSAAVKYAKLKIGGGATAYNLGGTTDQLFSAATGNDAGRYEFTHYMDDSTEVVDFSMKNHHGFDFDSDKNKVGLSLNTNPIWDVEIETGASSVDFDLSKFKVKELKLHGGAASFNVKLGMPVEMTDVDVSTGVSQVDISVPQGAACQVETDSGLSDNQIDGFTKTDDNNYETPGYAGAKNKMHIHISGGLSGFTVKRY